MSTLTTTPVIDVPAEQTQKLRRRGRVGQEKVNWVGTIILLVCALTVIVPLYVTITMAFKTTEQAVDGNAFSLPAPFSTFGFTQAWELTNFPRAFAISILVSRRTALLLHPSTVTAP